jgi:hypothetical protein
MKNMDDVYDEEELPNNKSDNGVNKTFTYGSKPSRDGSKPPRDGSKPPRDGSKPPRVRKIKASNIIKESELKTPGELD